MKAIAAALITMFLFFATSCTWRADPTEEHEDAPPERSLVGQLLLPPGTGSRGVEVRVMIAAEGSEPRKVWVLFDDQGKFRHSFQGTLTGLEVTAGIGRHVYRMGGEELVQDTSTGQVDVKVIDLRDRLTTRRLVVRAAVGSPPGVVRVGMWQGPPATGPGGQRVSLGSRQFSEVALGEELEWLLPKEASSIYFLVERPSDSGRGVHWRTGHQRLFGPFGFANIPAELDMD